MEFVGPGVSALSTDFRNSVDVMTTEMGRVFMAKGEYAKAVESLQRVISQDRELVSKTLEMLQTCTEEGRICAL